MGELKYKRILLKLSGEALSTSEEVIEPSILAQYAAEIKEVHDLGVEVAIVIATGITKVVLPPAARPAGIRQLTVWPADVQPAGSVPIVRPAGMVSVIAASTVVAAVPVFDSCSA